MRCGPCSGNLGKVRTAPGLSQTNPVVGADLTLCLERNWNQAGGEFPFSRKTIHQFTTPSTLVCLALEPLFLRFTGRPGGNRGLDISPTIENPLGGVSVEVGRDWMEFFTILVWATVILLLGKSFERRKPQPLVGRFLCFLKKRSPVWQEEICTLGRSKGGGIRRPFLACLSKGG